MSISRAGGVLEPAGIVAVWLFLGLWLSMGPAEAVACSCRWEGPFLTVVDKAPLAVRGRILRHHAGKVPAMDVLVLDTLKGGVLDTGLVVQMGDGMHCRPALQEFPPGTEWVLALNGPGSKPGLGFALSHCGAYWLCFERGAVVGNIDGPQGQSQRMPWEEFRNRCLYPSFQESFSAQVLSGERFHRAFGGRFVFVLEPMPTGWEIVIREYGRDENLARLTPPLHFSPNPREIEGWQLSNDPSACVSRSFAAEAGPENPRRFIFSPDVGRRIASETSRIAPGADVVDSIRRFGRGTLSIEDFRLQA